MLATTFFASQSQKRKKDGQYVFVKGFFFAAFFIHWFFIAFTRTGVDHDQYLRIIEYDALFRLAMGEEVGFNGLCVLLQRLVGNAELVIFIIKTVTLLLFYYSCYLLKEKASLGWVVGSYNAWQYLFSFCIIAHSLAISLVILAAALIMCEKKWYWPVILTIIAATIHTSALVMVALMLSVLFLNKFHFKMNFAVVTLLLIASIWILNNISSVFQMAITTGGMEQYSNNDASGNAGSGLFNYFLFAYIFVVLLLPMILSNLPNNVRNAMVLFYIFSFISAIMGYYLGTARLNQYALVFYGVAIPWYFYQIQNGLSKTTFPLSLNIQKVTWLLYVLFVAYSSLKTSADPVGTREMADYHLFNPFTWNGQY